MVYDSGRAQNHESYQSDVADGCHSRNDWLSLLAVCAWEFSRFVRCLTRIRSQFVIYICRHRGSLSEKTAGCQSDSGARPVSKKVRKNDMSPKTAKIALASRLRARERTTRHFRSRSRSRRSLDRLLHLRCPRQSRSQCGCNLDQRWWHAIPRCRRSCRPDDRSSK